MDGLKLTIEGVFEDFPKNGSLDYDILLSMDTYGKRSTDNWLGNDRYKGYVKLAQDREEAGVGTDQGGLQLISVLIQVRVPIENVGRTSTDLNTGDFFHKAYRYGSANLPVIVFIPVLRVPGANTIHPVDVLVETVVTQFEEHLGNEHNSHGQADAQGEDLDENI